MPVTGVKELIARLEKMAAASDAAGKRVVVRSQVTFEAAVKKSFTTSHKRGTPSPSKAGTPPSVISGTLRRSFVSDAPTAVTGGYSGRTFPTSVQARILELGGYAGRDDATYIPAHPYMAPTLKKITPILASIRLEEFRKVVL